MNDLTTEQLLFLVDQFTTLKRCSDIAASAVASGASAQDTAASLSAGVFGQRPKDGGVIPSQGSSEAPTPSRKSSWRRDSAVGVASSYSSFEGGVEGEAGLGRSEAGEYERFCQDVLALFPVESTSPTLPNGSRNNNTHDSESPSRLLVPVFVFNSFLKPLCSPERDDDGDEDEEGTSWRLLASRLMTLLRRTRRNLQQQTTETASPCHAVGTRSSTSEHTLHKDEELCSLSTSSAPKQVTHDRIPIISTRNNDTVTPTKVAKPNPVCFQPHDDDCVPTAAAAAVAKTVTPMVMLENQNEEDDEALLFSPEDAVCYVGRVSAPGKKQGKDDHDDDDSDSNLLCSRSTTSDSSTSAHSHGGGKKRRRQRRPQCDSCRSRRGDVLRCEHCKIYLHEECGGPHAHDGDDDDDAPLAQQLEEHANVLQFLQPSSSSAPATIYAPAIFATHSGGTGPSKGSRYRTAAERQQSRALARKYCHTCREQLGIVTDEDDDRQATPQCLKKYKAQKRARARQAQEGAADSTSSVHSSDLSTDSSEARDREVEAALDMSRFGGDSGDAIREARQREQAARARQHDRERRQRALLATPERKEKRRQRRKEQRRRLKALYDGRAVETIPRSVYVDDEAEVVSGGDSLDSDSATHTADDDPQRPRRQRENPLRPERGFEVHRQRTEQRQAVLDAAGANGQSNGNPFAAFALQSPARDTTTRLENRRNNHENDDIIEVVDTTQSTQPTPPRGTSSRSAATAPNRNRPPTNPQHSKNRHFF